MKNNKKKSSTMKKLLPAFAMLTVSAVSLSSATYAWFSMNTQVSATGMQVMAKAEGNLVINKAAVVPVGSTTTSVDFEDSTAASLIPVTYDTAQSGGGWKIVADATSVDMNTGSPDAATAAVSITANTHYVDKLVYIASNGNAMTGQTLTATVSKTETTAMDANNAIKVAFYYNATSADGSTAPSAIAPLGAATTISTTAEFPSVMSTAGGTPVLMRIYYDGAMESSTRGTAWINSAHVPTSGATVTVQFGATTTA